MVTYDRPTPPERPMGYQPQPLDPFAPMRELVRDLKRIDRSGRIVQRREWYSLARRFIRAKWVINGWRLKPPRGGSAVQRPTPPPVQYLSY